MGFLHEQPQAPLQLHFGERDPLIPAGHVAAQRTAFAPPTSTSMPPAMASTAANARTTTMRPRRWPCSAPSPSSSTRPPRERLQNCIRSWPRTPWWSASCALARAADGRCTVSMAGAGTAACRTRRVPASRRRGCRRAGRGGPPLRPRAAGCIGRTSSTSPHWAIWCRSSTCMWWRASRTTRWPQPVWGAPADRAYNPQAAVVRLEGLRTAACGWRLSASISWRRMQRSGLRHAAPGFRHPAPSTTAPRRCAQQWFSCRRRTSRAAGPGGRCSRGACRRRRSGFRRARGRRSPR